ncbi:MAG: serine/threonine protein kinase [Polyangiaceae bacterium]|nr:serine/threonine protein kinase [Polyangiaceae bacterium]
MPARLIDVDHEGRQLVDRYELVAEIASGGMATVFLARLSGVGGFQRMVAIKRLHPHLAGDQEFVDMFLDEARLAAGIHHPNVVSILEVGASPRGYYLVMEYIEGDTLARLLARAATSSQRVPEPIVIRVVLDMLAGLHAAHELKDEAGQPTSLVHRDVSPQNLLVGVDGVCRITDFGVARAATRLAGTRVGQLKGKIAYMAPEQALGQTDLDRRADVFAAGIVLWEVLAGRRLFKSENEAATLSRVLNDPIPVLHEAAPHVDPALSEIVMKALERDRDKRYATAAEFADALERVATALGKLAAPKELAQYVTGVLGAEIEQQRDAVRAWLARSEPSQAAPFVRSAVASSVSSAAMVVPGEGDLTVAEPLSKSQVTVLAPPAPKRTGLLIGVAAALLVGGVLLFLLGRSTGSGPGPAPTAAAVAVAPSPTPSARSEPAPPAAPSAVSPAIDPAASASAAPAPKKPAKPVGGGKLGGKGGEELPSNPYR